MNNAQPTRRADLGWPWLLIGFALLPFTLIQTMIPLAAWLAPIFLLRFSRTTRSGWVALTLIAAAEILGGAIAVRGGGDPGSLLIVAIGYAFLIVHALISTLPYAVDRWIGPRLNAELRTLAFPLAYTSVEWLMSLSKGFNTTGSAVYSQYDCLALMQIVSVFGMWGLTFLIGWTAATVNALWEAEFALRPVRSAVGLLVTVLTAVLLLGSIRLNFAPSSSPTVKAATVTIDRDIFAATVQPPFDWLTFNRSDDATRAAVRPNLEAGVAQLLARTETALRAGAKLVGWQETAARVLEEDRQQVIDRAAALAERYGAHIQISLGVFTRSPERPYYLDQSILIDGNGKVLWAYDKTYPVIPTEVIVTPYGLGRLPVAETALGRIATAICNDFHFPALIRQAGRAGADIMMAPYNSIPLFEQQDSVVAVMRAVENGYSMVRATGEGDSLIVDYEGRIRGAQRYGEGGGVMIADVPARGVVTIYSRIGDSFAYLCVLALAALAVWARRMRLAPRATGLSYRLGVDELGYKGRRRYRGRRPPSSSM
jgi:apolipoprotein N-acyltransferase